MRKPPGQTIASVRREIKGLCSSGIPTLDDVAKALGVSPRTLQRRLADNGLTFTKVLSEVQFVTARHLLTEQQKLAEVARKLGYSDPGSFTRAFERWTGMSPQKYRTQYCGAPKAVGRK